MSAAELIENLNLLKETYSEDQLIGMEVMVHNLSSGILRPIVDVDNTTNTLEIQFD